MRVLTTRQMREADKIAIEEYGIPGLILMENAGQGAATIALEMLENTANPSVCIFAGKGNNGGDAFVIARHLHNSGIDPIIYFTGSLDAPSDGDAHTNLQIARKINLDIREIKNADDLSELNLEQYDLIIDGLLGTGLSGEVTGIYRELILRINEAGAPVLALDIPSGLSGDDGVPLGVAIKATRTATFGAMKTGLVSRSGMEWAGAVTVVPISIPRIVFDRQ